MNKKITVGIILVAILILLGVLFFVNKDTDSKGSSAVPDYLGTEIDVKQDISDISINEDQKVGTLASPADDNSIQISPTESDGNVVKLVNQDTIIPIKNVLTAEWLGDSKILLTSGELVAPEMGAFNSEKKLEPLSTGENQGVFLYKIESQELVTLYSSNEDIPLFNAGINTDFILVCTGTTIEKFDQEGVYLKTLYEVEDSEDRLILLDQNNAPQGKALFTLFNADGLNSEKIEIDL